MTDRTLVRDREIVSRASMVRHLLFAAFFFLVPIVLFLQGCSNPSDTRPGSTLVIAFATEPHRLNPIYLSDLNSYTVSGWVFNGLMRLDHSLRPVGDLAHAWDWRDGGRELVFHLKKGVLWHDGQEFSAEDVVFTYRTIVSQKTASPLAAQFGPVKKVEALDRYTVKVSYVEPYGSALMSWTSGIVPAHVLGGKDLNESSFDRLPVGTGPYRPTQWVSGQQIVLEAFNGYFRGAPAIKRLVVRIIPHGASRMLELRKGNIDIMEVTPAQYVNPVDNHNGLTGFSYYRCPSFRYAFLGFNLLDQRFQNKGVRQAISHAIDKDSIIKAVLMGAGSRSTGPYPPERPYWSRKAKDFNFDPPRALELLNDAGWMKGPDGLLYREGKPFSFTITTNFESEENVKSAQIIQNNLKALGIDVKIRQLEWQTFRHAVISRHRFEAVILSRAYLPDPDLFDLWHSSRAKEGDWNFLSYRNSEVDRLLRKARVTLQDEKRDPLYKRFHETVAEDQPCVFLYNADGLFMARKEIVGIRATPLGIYQGVESFSVSRQDHR
jgi:peptide/nickel transport system substrate-binding protein